MSGAIHWRGVIAASMFDVRMQIGIPYVTFLVDYVFDTYTKTVGTSTYLTYFRQTCRATTAKCPANQCDCGTCLCSCKCPTDKHGKYLPPTSCRYFTTNAEWLSAPTVRTSWCGRILLVALLH